MLKWSLGNDGVEVARELDSQAWPWDEARVEQEADGVWAARLSSSGTDYQDLDVGRYETCERAKAAAETAERTMTKRSRGKCLAAGQDDFNAVTLVERRVDVMRTTLWRRLRKAPR